MANKRKSLIVLLASVLLSIPAAVQVPAPGKPLNQSLGQSYVARTDMVDAALALARMSNVPIGIEYVDRHSVSEQVLVQLGPGTSFDQALESIFSASAGYLLVHDSGVVTVRNRSLPPAPANLFDTVIPLYELKRAATIQEASTLLYMELDSHLHGLRGYAGSYNPGRLEYKIGPFALRNMTVRQILNTIVSGPEKAAWVALAPPKKLNKIPPEGLWTVVEYSMPVENLGSRLAQYSSFRTDEKP